MYLGLHGTYGLMWVLKSRIFPDRSWEKACTWRYALVIWFGLMLYWITPWLITSRGIEAPAWLLGACVAIVVLGVFLHFTTDMQKYIELRMQPEHLITTGMMARTRNMNYFGELLIYLGMALLAMHWLPLLVLAAFIVIIWIPNMRRKDRSLSRYAAFELYKRSTAWFLPFIL